MKLLSSAGLLYSAVSAETKDGHLGTFPEIDWAVTINEMTTSVTAAA